MFRTYKIQIKKGHRLYSYFQETSLKTKNLYNTTNFYVRQIISGYENDFSQTNQQDVLNTVNAYLKSKGRNEFAKDEKSYLSYPILDGIFKHTKNKDYYALPAHVNQHIMKEVFEAYTAFFNGMKAYRKNKTNFTGKPDLPKYASKHSLKTITFTNQVCVIKENKYLKFPKTKNRLNIGKLGSITGAILKEVRVKPHHNIFDVEVVFELPEIKVVSKEPNRIIGIDLGLNNFATITNNAGLKPFIINGKVIKSINHYFNKEIGRYRSILRNGLQYNQGKHTSRRIEALFLKRQNQLNDFMHKASRSLVDYCLQNDIDTVILGNNKNNKQGIQIGKDNNRHFVSIPFFLFAQKLKYKLEAEGINFIETEESYTSKASFLDGDMLPIYKDGSSTKYSFSGRRVKRGLYKTKDGILMNADCNGSANIIRKVIPNAFQSKGDSGVMDTPVVVNVLV